ncbi:MAG: AIPR family protein [Burkholderiales bacterium]|nr:AIPR family protein [Burkholderiales bacterium]
MTAHNMPPIVPIEDEKANEFAEILRAQVRELAEEEGDGALALDTHLLNVSMAYLEDQGGVSTDVGDGAVGSDDFVACPFRAKVKNTNLLVLGYLPTSSDGQLTLFSARYEDDSATKTLALNEFKSRVEQVLRFFRLAYNEPEALQEYGAIRGLIEHIGANAERIAELRIVFVTNLRLSTREYDRAASLGDIEVVYDIYDVDRLHRLSSDGIGPSDIVIDFEEVLGRPVPCLEATGKDHAYKSYLLILEGTTIHWLFKRYGPRLYDTNLRSYLDNKTKVNKEIIKTVREQPDRFLAYNNGLTATAQEIEVSLVHGQPCITRVVGLQIVNGAQTTGSIYKAKEAWKKQGDVDLSHVAVAVKLTKVAEEDLREFVPRITRYANTQNPIQAADLEANEELHRRMEQLSNEIWCPGTDTRWFYERTRGSYQAAMNREGTTPRRKAEFKREVPKDQRFGKTDLARYWMGWNLHPHILSRGAQKNFDAFKKLIGAADTGLPMEAVDERFYRSIVALAILYRASSAAVTGAGIGGGIGSMVKAYLFSYLAYRLADRIDLETLWQEQAVSQEMQSLLSTWAPLVRDGMLKNAGQHTTEWFKKEDCWSDVTQLALPLPEIMPPECDVVRATPIEASEEAEASEIEAEVSVVSPGADAIAAKALDLDDNVAVTKAVSAKQWFDAASWAANAEGFTDWDRDFAFDMAKYASRGWPKPPSDKQAEHAARIARGAMRAGVFQLR